MRSPIIACLFLALCSPLHANATTENNLEEILAAPHRKASAVRDVYRHPAATLQFFEVEPHHTVVEIWPGGGWYTEILAPYLKQEGRLYAAHFAEQSPVEYFRNSRNKFDRKLATNPVLYGNVVVTEFDPPKAVAIAPPASADRVLTFRNVHNWYMRGGGEERMLAAFKAFYKALKPGGMLGIVDHRLAAKRPLSDQEASGYMRQDYVISVAEKAGFKLLDKSEINANPKDTSDHPKGVWTLPPTLRLGETKKDFYSAIGESDRMTLKFVKPK